MIVVRIWTILAPDHTIFNIKVWISFTITIAFALIFVFSSPIYTLTFAISRPRRISLLSVSIFWIIIFFIFPSCSGVSIHLIIPLLLSSLVTLSASTFHAPAVFDFHKLLQGMIMLFDLILNMIDHFLLHFVELLDLLCRFQGLRLLLQNLLHLGFQIIFLVIFELVHAFFQFLSF